MASLVLVTRPLEQAKEFAARLSDLGYEPLICPLMDILPVSFSLPDAEDFDAVVATSQQVFSVSNDYQGLKNLPLYCVGDVTAQAARQSGFSDVVSGGSTVEELVATLQMKFGRTSRLLYVRGEDVRQNLAALCPEFSINDLVVYRAVLATGFPPEIIERFSEIGVVTLFSARTGRCFADLVRKNGLLSEISHIKLLSLSEAVIKSVSDLPWLETYCTRQPDAQSLLYALTQIA